MFFYFILFLGEAWGVFKTNVSIFVQYHLMLYGNFDGSEIRHGIFLLLNFGPGILWGVVGSPRDFFGF